MSQQSAWIKEQGASLVVEHNSIPSPRPGEILVKVRAIGFSPLEAKIQRHALVPIQYPNILGMSFSGIVESVGPDVVKVKAGDAVSVVRTRFTTPDSRFGAFQQYALAAETSTSKLQESVSLEASAASILNLAAVASAFTIFMGLDRPSLTGNTKPNGKKILIYGGSSPAGGLGVSYAVAAGYEVITTSSPANQDFVHTLKPAAILDHASATISNEIASYGPYDAVFDAIGLPPTTDIIASYVKSVGGGTYFSFLPAMGKPLPEGVKVRTQPFSFALDEKEHEEFRDWFYDELIPHGLGNGAITPTRAQWLEGGLEKVQEALDLMIEHKVSGKKLLLDPNA